MAKKQKYYVVWEGREPGVYSSWPEAKKNIDGYTGARYKSFKTRDAAEHAFAHPQSVTSDRSKKKKYYVVWRGFEPGIYTSWAEAQQQISGFTKPSFKTFGSEQLAIEAFEKGPEAYQGRSFKKTKSMSAADIEKYGMPNPVSLSVDAASNDKGDFEYRGVITESGTEVFHFGPMKNGSNNVGEFLAIVHALGYLKKNRSDLMIYTDSRNAMKWVREKKAKTTKTDAQVLQLLSRAEKWLRENSYENKIEKWHTKFWGEIPADFGRK